MITLPLPRLAVVDRRSRGSRIAEGYFKVDYLAGHEGDRDSGVVAGACDSVRHMVAQEGGWALHVPRWHRMDP